MTDDDNGGDTSPLYDYAASQAKMLFCGDMGELDRPNAPVELDDDNNNTPPLLDVGDRREAAWRARSPPATTDALGGSSDPDSSLSSPSQSSAAKRDLARLRGRLKQRSEPDALDRSWAASLGESPTKRSIAAEKVLHADWSDGGESTEGRREAREGAPPRRDVRAEKSRVERALRRRALAAPRRVAPRPRGEPPRQGRARGLHLRAAPRRELPHVDLRPRGREPEAPRAQAAAAQGLDVGVGFFFWRVKFRAGSFPRPLRTTRRPTPPTTSRGVPPELEPMASTHLEPVES